MPIHPALIAPYVIWSIWMTAFVAWKIHLDPRARVLYWPASSVLDEKRTP